MACGLHGEIESSAKPHEKRVYMYGCSLVILLSRLTPSFAPVRFSNTVYAKSYAYFRDIGVFSSTRTIKY